MRAKKSLVTDSSFCSVAGCEKPTRTAGWCTAHYERQRKTGDVRAEVPLRSRHPGSVCTVDGCGRAHECGGLCAAHGRRLKKTGSIDVAVPIRPRARRPDHCVIADCVRPVMGRRMCATHYTRWRQNGDPLDAGHRDPRRIRERRIEFFWSNVVQADGCWLWQRKPTPAGYGQMRGFAGHVSAHRFSYELLVGPIPEGLQLDHLCFNRLCVNPSHLEPVPGVVNRARAQARKASAVPAVVAEPVR